MPGRTRVVDGSGQLSLLDVVPLAVAEFLDGLDWGRVRGGVRGDGPRAMVGLVVYGTMEGAGSLRRLERMAGRDLRCMWVTGGYARTTPASGSSRRGTRSCSGTQSQKGHTF